MNEFADKEAEYVNRSFRMSREDFDKLTAIKDSIRAKMGVKLSINATIGYLVNKHSREADANG